jgi:NADH:ubiquinone oxidoreductase subunit E
VRGAGKVVERIEQELGIKTGETTEDLKFTLETVNCIGACALGPMVMVGEDYHGEMTPDAISSVLKNYT